MKAGDMLLISRKFDPIGGIIKWATKSEYNHVCIAVSEKHIMDIRAKKIEEIVYKERYLNDKFECKLVRYKEISDFEITLIIKYICNQKKKYTYLSWLISIILILFKQKPLRPTCSSLIAEAFAEQVYYFNIEKNPYEISPEDINTCSDVIDVTKELYD